MTSNPSVVILAGGNSSRMGKDKGLLSFQGRPLIEDVLTQVVNLCDEIIILSNQDAK